MRSLFIAATCPAALALPSHVTAQQPEQSRGPGLHAVRQQGDHHRRNVTTVQAWVPRGKVVGVTDSLVV